MHITCTAELYIFITHAWYAYMYSMFINIITKRVMQVRKKNKKLGYRILFVTTANSLAYNVVQAHIVRVYFI